jgi:hypothetical protein
MYCIERRDIPMLNYEVKHYALNKCKGSGVTAPLFLTSALVSDQLYASSALPSGILLTYFVDLVRKQTILTEPPPLVGEVSANFCG